MASSASVNRRVLEAADRLAERLAVLGVLQRLLQHGLHAGGRHHRDADAFLRKVLHQVDEARALLAEQVLGGHLHVGEGQLRGVLGVETDLVEVAAALEARHPPLDDQQREAQRALVGVGAGHDDHQVGVNAVGDERLRAVEHPAAVLLLDGAGLDALQVAAGAGLGHGDRGDSSPEQNPGSHRCFCSSVRQPQQVGRDDVVLQREAQPAVAAGRGLLGDDDVVAEVGIAAAAVLLGHGHAEEALLARLQPHAAVDDLVLLPLLVEGRDVALEERAVGLAEQVVLGLEERAVVLEVAPMEDLRIGETGFADDDIPPNRMVGTGGTGRRRGRPARRSCAT